MKHGRDLWHTWTVSQNEVLCVCGNLCSDGLVLFLQGLLEAKLLCLGEFMCLWVYLSLSASEASHSLTLACPDGDNVLGLCAFTQWCKHGSSSTIRRRF